MKTLGFLALAAFLILLGAGCDSLLSKQVAQNNPMVGMFGVNTNDVALVSYLKAADSLNTAVNVTATEAPIHMLLAGLTTLAAGAAGWYARHKSAATDTASTVASQLAQQQSKG